MPTNSICNWQLLYMAFSAGCSPDQHPSSPSVYDTCQGHSNVVRVPSWAGEALPLPGFWLRLMREFHHCTFDFCSLRMQKLGLRVPTC